MHSTEFGRSGNVHHEGGDSARIREIEREGCEYADKVIAVSGRLCDEVKMFNCGHKLRMVYNGVQLHHFEGFINAGEFKAKYGIGPLQPMVLFVGRLALQKGPDILIDAIPGILSAKPDAVMVLVGDGHMRGDLERRVKDMEKGHAVRFVGSQAGQELRNFYKAAELLNSGPFIKILLHNHSVIYKIIFFFFRRSKRQRNFSLFYFASRES